MVSSVLETNSANHPPKALGQTCMNMFYYGALKTALKIYTVLDENAMADVRKAQMDALHDAVEHELYDAQRQMFFEGLNTPTEEKRIGHWMPQNVEKRYYRKHANILAAYFGSCGSYARATRKHSVWFNATWYGQ